MKNNKFIVYADMNCPFCYSLHERLIELDLLDMVDWRLVEHAPSIKFDTDDLKIHAELTTEVNRVREVAEEINIIIPAGRPNSHEITQLIQAANEIDPQKAQTLRTLAYRSLWIEGLDFSDEALLQRLCQKAGLSDLKPHIDPKVLEQWQREWECGDFSRNIPVLVAEDGNKLLGLPSLEVLSAFLTGNDHGLDFDVGSFCYIKPREKLLIASENTTVLDRFAAALENDYNIEFAQYGDAVYQSTLSSTPPDLIIMDIQLPDPNGFETCIQIKDNEVNQNTAIILFSDNRSVKDEVKAFDCGAVDFITLSCADEVLRARVRVLLRLKRTTDLLEQYSRLDGLTEIPNRREFDRIFEKEWRRAMRSQEPLSLILLDVDYFKLYNDNYGHMEGDQCLKKVADALEKAIRRPHDVVARYGGEEFVIILPETSPIYAEHVAETIRQAIHNLNIEHKYSKINDHITASLGISTVIPHRKMSTKSLIDAADNALYQAKEQGRNRAVFNNPEGK